MRSTRFAVCGFAVAVALACGGGEESVADGTPGAEVPDPPTPGAHRRSSKRRKGGGAGASDCSPGHRDCFGTAISECDGKSYRFVEDCAARDLICYVDPEGDTADCGPCIEGESYCAGNAVAECRGASLAVVQDCGDTICAPGTDAATGAQRAMCVHGE